MSERDKRALLILGLAAVAALVLEFGLPAPGPAGTPEAGVSASSIQLAERRVRRLQEVAKQRPRAAAEAEAAAKALAETEKGLLKAATPALAEAQMQQLMKDMLGAQGINMQSSEFGLPKAAGGDYAQAPLTVNFTCGIEQWINLMAALRNAPQVLSSVDIRLAPADAKNKTVQVHMVVAGYIPASLVAPAKGAAAL
ncbi:MAG TPA: type II secretion system protein GspM [Bryobacterales bacterium]|nr:type II secretion system protein GspM [Bryobacterales bacterium]